MSWILFSFRNVSTFRRQDGHQQAAVNKSLGVGRRRAVVLVGAPEPDFAAAEGVPPGIEHLAIEAQNAFARYACGERSERGETVINGGAGVHPNAAVECTK